MKTVKSASMPAATPNPIASFNALVDFELETLVEGEGCTTAGIVAVVVAGMVIASWENEVGGDDGAK